MGFLSIYPYQFRNLFSDKISTQAEVVFLVGENGQGKTNFLETIYLLCFGSSFRTNNNAVLVAQGKEEMSVYGEFENTTEADRLTIAVSMKEKKKEITVSGKKIKDRKELVRNVPCIVFSHDDIEFVKGAPERKRFFFNQVMSLYKPAFIDSLRHYNKIVKMRNAELKEGNIGNLDIYDVQLAEYGRIIQEERKVTIGEFNSTFHDVYKQIHNDSSIQIGYSPSWKGCEDTGAVLEILEKKRCSDRECQFTTSGPHRDRFLFRKNGKNFAATASTGQFRLAALTLRAAQAVFFSEKTGRKPILLLDDVLLELDGRKKETFLEALPDFDQAFFTFLPEENYRRFYPEKKTLIYKVQDGKMNYEKSG
jgi:DNA replication and repair protein RecF